MSTSIPTAYSHETAALWDRACTARAALEVAARTGGAQDERLAYADALKSAADALLVDDYSYCRRDEVARDEERAKAVEAADDRYMRASVQSELNHETRLTLAMAWNDSAYMAGTASDGGSALAATSSLMAEGGRTRKGSPVHAMGGTS